MAAPIEKGNRMNVTTHANSIYQRIGYVPVADSSQYRFAPSDGLRQEHQHG